MSPSSRLSMAAKIEESVNLSIEEAFSEDDDAEDGRQVASPLSTGDSDDDVELFDGPKQVVAAKAMAQDDHDDSPLFKTSPRVGRPRKVPSRTHPGRSAILADDDDDDDDHDAMSKSTAGQWMQEVETAFQRVSSAASNRSTGDSSEVSDWRESLLGSDTELDPSAREGDSLSLPPRISNADVSDADGDESTVMTL